MPLGANAAPRRPANTGKLFCVPIVCDKFGRGALALAVDPADDALDPSEAHLMGKVMGAVDAARAIATHVPWGGDAPAEPEA